jgi:LacI family transcriptional regulator
VDPVKIIDLAARLGLDKSTVSRALNNRPGVAPETREKITRMAQEMGYRPNVHGQQLRGWKSTTLGLVLGGNVPHLSSLFFGPFTLKLYGAAAERGYDLLILSHEHHPDESIADVLVRRGAFGGILLGWQSDDVLAAMSDSPLPCIQVDNYAADFPTLDYVCSDNRTGAYEITRHLLDQGHRRLAYIADRRPVDEQGEVAMMMGLSPFRERYEGFQQVVTEAGAQEIVCDDNPQLPEESARQLLSRPNAPTAIVAASDGVAASVSQVAQSMGRQVPRDLSLTGFDDVDPHLVEKLKLTTVRVDQLAQAHAAVGSLLDSDAERDERIECRIPTELIVRGSTAPPPDPAAVPKQRLSAATN